MAAFRAAPPGQAEARLHEAEQILEAISGKGNR
jgi:hypothetical protein